MIVVLSEEIRNPVGTVKSTPFIKGDGKRTFSCPDQKRVVFPMVLLYKKVNQRFSISFPVKRRSHRNIFNFKGMVPCIQNNALPFDAVIFQDVHCPFGKISVNHIFLLICQEQQI